MAVNSQLNKHLLPCERLVEDLFDDLDAGRSDEHRVTCEHCATAERSLHHLLEATRALIDDPAEPPPNLLDRIMGAVRAELRRVDVLPLPAELGPADISAQAVASVLRYAVDTVAGVRARSCRIELEPDHADTVRITLSLSLHYGAGPIRPLLDEVRHRLHAALAGQVGLRADAIDVDVVDVWDERSS